MTDERIIYGENGIPRPNPALPELPPEEEPEQFRGEPFARRVVSYLLGQMSEEEAEQFEDDCFAQKRWPSQIQSVEDDLIDAYLHKELPLEQRALFEQNYLTTEARWERVRMAAALLRQVCEPEVVEPPVVVPERSTWVERLKAFRGGRGWVLRLGSVAAALFILIGGTWFYLARIRPPRAVATLTLTGSVMNRSEGVEAGTIKLSPNVDALKVFLTLPERATPAQRYRAELDSEDGETSTLTITGQDGNAVSVLIPASLLARGQYAVTLLAVGDDGDERPYGTYFFNVE
jgi:hypothetical protein